jgi:hypothetical protein
MLSGKACLKVDDEGDHHDVSEKSNSLFSLSHMFPE